ncbi:MAG: family 10 glycosylhydrolase [Eubacterium sp.]|nr:family 10 glycosylhydrolase [Eubacterium sp.]
MKKYSNRKCYYKAVIVIVAVFLFMGYSVPNKISRAGSHEHRGVWVAFYEFSAAGLSNRTEAAFRQNASKMFQNIVDYGCNEVFFHVRAFDDAIYPSKIVRWSTYMESNGKSPGYDPLAILVELAHEKGLKIHAWMNPYRVSSEKILNPAKEKTINRIVNQVKEIINNYQVDGIHFDDYFYVGSKYDHVRAAKKRKNVNKMVKRVHDAVKEKDETIEFGISPAGNYENCMEMGADVKTWMSEEGYIDYIIPQIYWSDKYKLNGKWTTLFSDRLALWRSLNEIDIPMCIGLGVYRTGYEVSPDLGWAKRDDNLASQALAIFEGNTEGYTLFAYTDLMADHSEDEMDNFLEAISWIKLNKKSVTLRQGETFLLKAKWMPAKYEDGDSFEYRSLDESIATVDEDGLVTAVAQEGTTKIQVTADGKKKNCVVTIGEINEEAK